ncbi:transcriptional regulator SlyA [Methanobrevibacter cuticularis]|uniref:Transcriptional regulator SlyA n=1 Tax=Methanobrevibacter cuticularis TaxID=47311 RepID=A0A166EDM7_9EURY|nr:MarR family winged helix-turn-helix transcriptional regulator [Methanobrevibacter cuticularis]KZX16539.1 transcriptional regulator SlyA [Methanobrevibacter cuticularis]
MDFNKEFHRWGLDDSVMAELMSFIVRGYNIYLANRIQDLNVTPGQIRFILLLNVNENASQEELAHQLLLSRGTAAKTLRKLDDENIIQRTIDPQNRRKYGVVLTDKGKEIAEKIEKIDKDWEKSIYEHFEGDNKEVIKDVLKKLAISSMKTIQDERIDRKDFPFMDYHPRAKFHHHRGHFNFRRF